MPGNSQSADTDPLSLEMQASVLISQVGARVLAARKAKRYSRRELSEKSGVSTRYLVQLEGGDGNISIGLLKRIAIALEIPIEDLVRNDAGQCADEARMVKLYRSADPETRAQVLRVLDPQRLRDRKAARICLIGLRGAGKSTLGSRLSMVLNIPFIELNAEIERSAGIPLGEIIALYGEDGYRTLEAETLKTIIGAHQRLVLAVAGGVVEQPDTFAELLERCHTVWLQADPTEHMERVRAQGDLRPMADNPRAMVQLREILKSRQSRYQQADYHLSTRARTVDESLDDLSQLVAAHDLLSDESA